MKILVFDSNTRARLQHLSALKNEYTVQSENQIDLVMRSVRSFKPDLLLVSVNSRKSTAELAVCRRVKTDGNRSTKVAIIDGKSILKSPKDAVEMALVDGFLSGTASQSRLLGFVSTLFSSGETVFDFGSTAKSSIVGRLRKLF